MSYIREYLKKHLLSPLKQYPTIIQETLIELIIQKLEKLYEYTILFPEIVSPDKSRLDIVRVIANQFLFTIREEADLQEQIDILDNILYVYSKRGSIDTIENMWKYYGGDLPKDVQVIIPTYNLFRYSISPFSYTHVFQDSEINRPGVYEVRLTNNTYPIPKLQEFMLKELVAAGNRIYFTNAISAEISVDNNPSAYKYDISTCNLLELYHMVYCTPTDDTVSIVRNLYNDDGVQVTEKYFIIGESLLNESLGYEEIIGE